MHACILTLHYTSVNLWLPAQSEVVSVGHFTRLLMDSNCRSFPFHWSIQPRVSPDSITTEHHKCFITSKLRGNYWRLLCSPSSLVNEAISANWISARSNRLRLHAGHQWVAVFFYSAAQLEFVFNTSSRMDPGRRVVRRCPWWVYEATALSWS